MAWVKMHCRFILLLSFSRFEQKKSMEEFHWILKENGQFFFETLDFQIGEVS